MQSSPPDGRGNSSIESSYMNIRDIAVLRSPVMYFPSMLLGALFGWWLWPIVAFVLIRILDVIYRGFPVILYEFLTHTGTTLGAATGMALVTLFCRWRRIPGWLLLFFAPIAFCWGAVWAWDCSQSGGRRLAFAIIIVPMMWIAVLGWLGYRASGIRGFSWVKMKK